MGYLTGFYEVLFLGFNQAFPRVTLTSRSAHVTHRPLGSSFWGITL